VNTTDTAGTSGTRLSCVQDLLDHLNSLKNDGLGAQERLDFLMSSGPALVPGFSFQDAFDAEARTMRARLQQIEDMDIDFRQLMSSWRAAPIKEDVRQAGGKLFEHLQGFIGDARKAEVKSEIEMLSQVWDDSPDLRHLYPWLTAWTGQIPEVVKTIPFHPEDMAEPESSTPEEEDVLDEDATAGMKADLERQVTELDQGKHLRRDYEVKKSSSDEAQGTEGGRVVSSVARHVLNITEATPRIRQEAWTEALRDISLEKWEFRTEAKGHLGEWGHGQAMLWKHGLESYSGARLEWAPSREGHQNVRLYISSDALGPRELKRELTDAQLLELHVDPSSLVEEALRIDPGSFMDESLR